tara:strand:- start:765 stop:1034 length:270 start_codon:yes stop_codon:yes gene_type:complete
MEILQNLGSLPIFFLMFIIIYVLMIRPQVTQQKKHESLITNLKLNDKIIMRDGICGKIIEFIDKDRIKILSANDSKLTVLKSYVSSLDK